jgi:hypothetical protein
MNGYLIAGLVFGIVFLGFMIYELWRDERW